MVGLIKGILSIPKRFLEILAGIADEERFTKWKNDLEDALKKLEIDYKSKKMRKKEYLAQKKIYEEKIEIAKKLIEKAQGRLKGATVTTGKG
jgi:GMP synthase PP-ATPase subunit